MFYITTVLALVLMCVPYFYVWESRTMCYVVRTYFVRYQIHTTTAWLAIILSIALVMLSILAAANVGLHTWPTRLALVGGIGFLVVSTVIMRIRRIDISSVCKPHVYLIYTGIVVGLLFVSLVSTFKFRTEDMRTYSASHYTGSTGRSYTITGDTHGTNLSSHQSPSQQELHPSTEV